MNDFSRTVDLLHRTMDANTLRYQITANNLANSGVPNFKRTSLNFESELKRALESEAAAKDSFRMTVSDPRHIQSSVPVDYRSVEPRRVTDYLSTSQANGNNVDPEQEAMEVLKIQLNYKLLSQMQAFEFSQIKTAIK